MRIAGTVSESIVDGPGLRLTVFTQGCPHRCPGCHNPQTHDPAGGREESTAALLARYAADPLLDGLTLSGGEPMEQAAECAALAEAARWLDAYFSGREPDFLPPLHPHGTAFQRAVWDILRSIPYGQTMTYGEIARRLAAQQGLSHMSAQAVGGAVGHNPISLIVPCHRVVGANGSLTGYAGGVERKLRLLQIEHADTEKLFLPHRGTAL